jgi:hypothetical protein
MRVVALVFAGLLFSAVALPAAAECPYKDQVARSEIQKPAADGSAATQSRG